MISLRKASERGHANHGWLDTYHTFSFADYYDPAYSGFRTLRVINEDRVLPGEGFPTHSHRDMEIITYVLEGQVEHQDSMGNKGLISPGDVQRMSAGTGVTHSEYNPSKKNSLHLLQIWILPEKKGAVPGYEQKNFPAAGKKNRLCLVASRSGRENSVKIGQDTDLYVSVLDAGKEVLFEFPDSRYGWIQIAKGRLTLNGIELNTGDGAAISGEKKIRLQADLPSEMLLFDLA